MKRSLFYMVILAVILVLPTKATDVGKLRPVQTVAVFKNGSFYEIKTDTKDWGRGETVDAAIKDLKATTPAAIYLDTAQYLIVSDATLVNEMRPYLKGSVRICQFTGEPPMETVSKFLSAHSEEQTLRDWKEGGTLQLLDCTKERFIIVAK